jgi:exodeoxyribonuclease V alpha subunit
MAVTPRHAPHTAAAPPRELLSGTVERVTFHSDDTGFCVLRVAVPSIRDLVTVVGHAAVIAAGEHVQASGTWVTDRTHGRQFRSSYLNVVAPDSREGIERYLASGLMKGIGPHFARRLVDAFGTAVFDVVEREPSRLRDVPGIGAVRAARIAESWQAQRNVREIMVFLHAHGVGTSRAVRIHKTYGSDAIGVIRDNPFRLARDIRGIGFLTADRIARKLGIAPTAMTRVRAGLQHVLLEAQDEGHAGLPREVLSSRAVKLLGVPDTLVSEAVTLELSDGALVADTVEGTPVVFLAWLHAAERAIAERLGALASGAPPWPGFDVEKALAWVQQRLQLTLAPSQRDALRVAVTRKALVITGGPGVGKTTLLNAILRVLCAKSVRPLLCAPTGRAAKRLSESTGIEAKTIHRLLEVDPRTGRFRRDERQPLEGDLVVVDETSMVDIPLMHALLRAVPARASVVFVGDVDQLPSVGPGQVLADVIDSGRLPVVRLTEVFRQAQASRIIIASHRINAGELPDLSVPDGPSDFYFVEAGSSDEAAQRVLQVVGTRLRQRFGFDPVRDVQVLCPMNRGSVGAHALNAALQQVLNPSAEPSVQRFGFTFSPGDRVMQVENDYDKDVYNGDLGRIRVVEPEKESLLVDFDGRLVAYDFGELDRLVLAYATTIHKSQGSEYPAVVIPITTQHYPMLQRNLVYTAVTRGRKLVVLIGERKALAIAVRGRQTGRRWSTLKELLGTRPRLPIADR